MIKQITEEAKIRAFSPKYAEGMLSISFRTTTPDEDGSVLPMMAMPLGYVVEWMKIIQKEARAEERERVRGIFDALPRKFWEDQDHAVGGYISKKDLRDLLSSLDESVTIKE